jgi:hypothetical protein
MLWVLSLDVILAARLVGWSASAPNALQALGFARCEDSLCYRGIKPGVASFDDAAKIMAQHGATTLPANISGRLTYIIGDFQVDLYGYNVVTAIDLVSQDNNPLQVTLGDALKYLGDPCRIEISDTYTLSEMYELIYPFGDITASLYDYSDVNPSIHVSSIVIFSPYNSPNICEGYFPWRGLKTQSRYQETFDLWVN